MKRILVRGPNWIGDQIMTYPFYYFLRKQNPKAWIAVIVTEWVQDTQFRGLIDEVYVIPKKKDDSIFTSLKKIRELSVKIKNSGPWDWGISLPNSFGSALLLKWSGAIQRRGYNTDLRGLLLNEKIKWNPSPDIHRVEAYAALLGTESLPEFRLRDFWSESGEKSFDPQIHWPSVTPLEPPAEKYAVIAPGAIADSRRWSAEQYGELIQLIFKKYGIKSVIVGGNAEKQIAAKFLSQGLPIIDYTGKGSVSALWKVFGGARFTVCNESGLAHVSAFCGSPTHIVCGAADPKRTRPIGPAKVTVSINPIECWPCERNVCLLPGDKTNLCLKGINPSSVVEEL